MSDRGHLRQAELRRFAEQLAAVSGSTLAAYDAPHEPHLVVVQESGEVSVEDFASLDLLVQRLRELHGTDTYAVPFIGCVLPITPAMPHFLVLPDDTQIPLVDITADEDTAVAWHLGESGNPPHVETLPPDDDDYLDVLDGEESDAALDTASDDA